MTTNEQITARMDRADLLCDYDGDILTIEAWAEDGFLIGALRYVWDDDSGMIYVDESDSALADVLPSWLVDEMDRMASHGEDAGNVRVFQSNGEV